MNRIIGIDLGTSTSEVSCIIDGKPVIIPNSLGKGVTPSIVHIGEDGEILVGEPAGEYLLTRPDCTFMEVKRLTGSNMVLNAHGKDYTPEDIQAMLLKYLVSCAEEYLNEKIDRAVITVPAYFTDIQRRATTKAGQLAGIEVCRIINEPTAAALDYGLMNLKECKNVLVYDFGGGTLDVTVLELFEGVIDVKASSGNNHLGGKDFDEIVMQKLAHVGNDERARMRLKKAAEECKKTLSVKNKYEVSLPFLLTGSSGRPISVEKTVTKADFEEWIKEKVDSTKEPIKIALADGGLSVEDLDVVLLVGGSTRIPCVQRLVAETLNIEPKTIVDPDLTVARGAAIQAGILEGSITGDEELILTDVCPYTLGMAVAREGLFDDVLVFDPIIPRNMTIPAEKSKIYYPRHSYQTQARLEVYQGDSTTLDNNERLGEVMLSGIPSSRKGKEPIEVTFSYDMNGILQVKGRILSTNQEVSVEINTAGVEPRPVIDISKWESAPGARKYRPVIRKAQKLLDSTDGEFAELELLIIQLKEALILENENEASELKEALTSIVELTERLS